MNGDKNAFVVNEVFQRLKVDIEGRKKLYEDILLGLESECVRARDGVFLLREDGVIKKVFKGDEKIGGDDGAEYAEIPIYLTKARIKRPESAYLKMKKDDCSFGDLKDVAGLRMITLFERDIYDVHDFLLFLFKDNKYALRSSRVYNWQKKEEIVLLDKTLQSYYTGSTILPKKKKTGYKSVHYVFSIRKDSETYFVEVQLRTLVQDVWGELAHKLAYKKGAVNPYITKSFGLAAKELETVEDLFGHLRDISDKEKTGEMFLNYKVGPKYFFSYEDDVVFACFNKNDAVKNCYEEYWSTMKRYDPDDISDEWLSKAKQKLGALRKVIGVCPDENEWYYYWDKMESAFLLFCQADYAEAMEIYKSLQEKYKERYCVFFRIGELYSLQDDMVSALTCFDEVDQLIDRFSKDDYLNQYRIKTRMALVYWSLGEEYVDIAVKKIKEAYGFLKKVEKAGSEYKYSDRVKLLNNMCWYFMERYLVNKEKKYLEDVEVDLDNMFAELSEVYDELSGELEGDYVSRNMLDTAAWYNYNLYRRTGNIDDLRKSVELCFRMRKAKNNTLYAMRSRDLQNEHFQEILRTANDVLGDSIKDI